MLTGYVCPDRLRHHLPLGFANSDRPCPVWRRRHSDTPWNIKGIMAIHATNQNAKPCMLAATPSDAPAISDANHPANATRKGLARGRDRDQDLAWLRFNSDPTNGH